MSRSTIQHERNHGRQAVAGRLVARRFGLKTALATTVVVAGLGLTALPAFAGVEPIRPVGGGEEVRCAFGGVSVAPGEKIIVVETSGKKVTLGCKVTGGGFLVYEPNGRVAQDAELTKTEFAQLEKEAQEVKRVEETP
jgi:hypothetical protein